MKNIVKIKNLITIQSLELRIAGGASLAMDRTQVHEYAIYGQRHNYARPELGRSLVAIGYRRAF